jgi:DNA helicase II / ATP-dependent DNA helicase PcrA
MGPRDDRVELRAARARRQARAPAAAGSPGTVDEVTAPRSLPTDLALNRAQCEAATALEGPMLVVAGAGTGKTRVIEARTALLLHAGVPAERILLLTFTRKAAAEMLRRTARHHPAASKVHGGTFHAVAFALVARYYQALGLARSPTVIDQDDAASAIAVVVQRLGFARDKRRRLPRSVSLATAFSRSTNLQRSLAAIVERTLPEFVDEVERIREVRNAYVAYKLERCYVDYDDLLVMLRALLRQPRLRGSIASRWSHVLVDEYQDVNALQAEITLALAEPHHNVMVVGDPKQSIYAFRGGRFEKIVEFAEHLPGTRIVHLTDNYRSTQAVLDTVNAVMRTMRSSLAEPLVSAVDPGGVAPTLRLMRDEQAAAMHLADTLQEHLDGPAGLRDFGVLFRSAYVSLPLQGELVRRKIPFQVFGGRRITELAHVRDVLAYLRLLHDPYDELAWMRVLKLLPGIGEVSAAAMFRDFTDRDALDATGEPGPLERAVKRAGRHGGARSRAAIAALVELLASLPRATSLVEAYDRVLASYEPLLQQRFDDARVRRADLEFFRIVVSSYDDLGGLLADLALDPDLGRKVEAGAPHPGEGIAPVTLSTIHSAKGLEWEHVFVIGVSDGELPSGHALRQSDPEAALAALEEERRLLYVALTRARRNLEVLHAVYGQRGMYELSRFLAEPEVMASFTLVDGTADPTADAEAATGSAAARAVDAASLLAQLRGEDLE